jgi:uncharacterized membrane protein YeaQ/YmgE (transglycosylase-associated protein family)
MNELTSFFQHLSSQPYTWVIVLGFVVGLVARILTPGPDPMGILMTTLTGVAGSFLGNYAAQYSGVVVAGQVPQFAVSVAGAMVLLIAYKFIRNV